MSLVEKQISFLRRHFPENTAKWKIYLKIFLPIMIGSVCFALNGVVDNFMVGHINQGQAALGAINSWTNILMGFFLGTSAGGSVVLAQFYHAKKYNVVKEIARYRFYLCIIPALVLATIAWTTPETLAKVWLKNDDNNKAYILIMDNAKVYARVIAIQWILISFTFNYGNQLRELGYGKYAMIWGFGTLVANMALNSILMYGVNMGVAGAAWASVAGRIVALTSGFYVTLTRKIKIGFKPWTIFNVSFETRKLIWRRWPYIFSIFTVTFFVTFRNFFYSRGYPSTDELGVGVSGLSVVALTGALMSIFTTTFSALSSMSANFVASELGKNNIPQAKKNSDELKGFEASVAATMSILLIIFASFVPFMHFLAETKYDETGALSFDGKAQLRQVSHSLYVVCLYYPIWIWFSASYRNGNAGGKGGKFALVDWIISGLQLGWLAVIMYGMVPNSIFMQEHFWMAYMIFFVSDFAKLIGQEWLYYKYDWLHVLTKTEAENESIKAQDFIQGNAELPNDK